MGGDYMFGLSFTNERHLGFTSGAGVGVCDLVGSHEDFRTLCWAVHFNDPNVSAFRARHGRTCGDGRRVCELSLVEHLADSWGGSDAVVDREGGGGEGQGSNSCGNGGEEIGFHIRILVLFIYRVCVPTFLNTPVLERSLWKMQAAHWPVPDPPSLADAGVPSVGG